MTVLAASEVYVHSLMHTTPLLLLLPRCPGTQISPNLLSSLTKSRNNACIFSSRRRNGSLINAAGYATSAAPDEPGQPARKDRSRQLSSLQRYGRDLTAEARRGLLDPVIGRQDVIQRTLQVLLRRSKHNPLLIGEAGVGKTAIVEGIAQLMAAPQPLRGLADKRLVALDVASVVAGSTYRGEFEERLQGLLHDCENAAGSVVLFIDEIHVLVGAGNTEGGLDFANMLKPALARSVLQVIGATTLDEYRQHIETDPALTRRFQPILVEEPSPQECLQLLTGLAPRYEAFHRVKFSTQALATAVTAAQRYIPERRLPDSAIDLIDEAAAKVRLAAHNTPQQQQQQQPASDRETDGSSGGSWLAGIGSHSSSSGSSFSGSSSSGNSFSGSSSSSSSSGSSFSGSSSSSSGSAAINDGSVRQASSLDSSSNGGGSSSSGSNVVQQVQFNSVAYQNAAQESNMDSFAAQVQQEIPSIASVMPAAAAAAGSSSSSAGSVSGSRQQQEKQKIQQQSTTADKPRPSATTAISSSAAAAATTSGVAAASSSNAAAAAPASWADWITARGWRGESEVHRQQLLEWFGASPAQPLKGVLGHKQTTSERRKKHAQLFGHHLAAAAAATGQHSIDGSSSSGGAALPQTAFEARKHKNNIDDTFSDNDTNSSSAFDVDNASVVHISSSPNPNPRYNEAKAQNPKPQQDLQTLNPEWQSHDHSPRSCPHCGTLVTAPREQLRLQCPNCGFRFLNLAPEKLQLGTTVLLGKQQQQWVLDSGRPVRSEADVILPVINAVTSLTATVFPKTPDRRAAVAVHEQPRHHAQQSVAAAAAAAAATSSAAAAEVETPRAAGDIHSSSTGSSRNGLSSPSIIRSSSRDSTYPASGSSSSSGEAPTSAAAAAPQPDVTSDHILEVVSEATGIPLALLSTGIPTATGGVTNIQNNTAAPAFSTSTQAAVQELSTIHAALTTAVLGQESAAAAVIGALRLSRLGLHYSNNNNSSSSSFLQGGLQEPQQQQQQHGRLSLSLLLHGPSGVGKSRTATVLASCLMPGEAQGVLHLSCGELSERHSISRLVGAPPGYVGYGKGGLLTEAIRRRPHSVVIFDDVERAHPDVVGLLLQAVEEGRLMDSLGHSINLRSTTFIFTANTTAPSITGNTASSTAVGGYSKQQAVQQQQQQQAVQHAASAVAVRSISSFSRSVSTGGWGLEGAELEGDESSANPCPAAAANTPTAASAPDRSSRQAAAAAAPSNPAAAAAPTRDAMVTELGSRVDDVIQFHPLNPKAMSAIVQQQLQQAAAAAAQQGVLLHVEDPAAEWLVTAGGSKTSGVRVLGQLIRRHVMVPLAAYIMDAAAAADKTGLRNGVHGTAQCVSAPLHAQDAAMTAALAAAGDMPGTWAVAVLGTAAGQELDLRFEQL